jgi:hypothetical protein
MRTAPIKGKGLTFKPITLALNANEAEMLWKVLNVAGASLRENEPCLADTIYEVIDKVYSQITE